MDTSFSVVDTWSQMSLLVQFLMIFMMGLSAYALVVVIERAVTFSRASRQTYSYVLALREYLGKRRTDEALSAARRHDKSPVASVVASGLEVGETVASTGSFKLRDTALVVPTGNGTLLAAGEL